jgi:CBS-domain-containing membrane protein
MSSLVGMFEQVEQSLRLMSFQRMGSLSISWGRMIQMSSEGMLLVNIYGDNGCSGGAVVDREGHLVGILSMSTLGKQVAYIEPVVPIIRALQNIMARGG